MWYYNLNNQQNGPVDEDTIKSLIGSGAVTAQTLVWRAGMERWMPLPQTPLAALIPAGGPPPIAPAPAPPAFITSVPQESPEVQINQIHLYFKQKYFTQQPE